MRECTQDGCEKQAHSRGLCRSHYDKRLKRENPDYAERQRENVRRWYARNPDYRYPPEKRAAINRKRTEKARARLAAKLAEQGGVCALCGADDPPRWHYDHDHETGVMRDVLCPKCNNGLGFFNDSADELRRAAAYLDRHNRPPTSIEEAQS